MCVKFRSSKFVNKLFLQMVFDVWIVNPTLSLKLETMFYGSSEVQIWFDSRGVLSNIKLLKPVERFIK